MRLTKNLAFSLTEILIVISIIAILAAIAVAQYQNYAIRAKIAQGMIVLNNIGSEAKLYYDKHGVFPNLQQVGLYHDPGDPTQSPMAASLNEYIANYVPYSYLSDQTGAYSCPTAAYGGYISNLAPGDYITQNQNGSVITVNQILVYVNNTYETYCQYFYMKYDQTTQTTTNVSGNFMPNCENGQDDPNAPNFFPNAGNQC